MIQNFPLVKIFNFDLEHILIYDARMNLVFLYPKNEMSHLKRYFSSQGTKDTSVSENIKTLKSKAVLLPGPMEYLDKTDESSIKEKLTYFKKNILMRKFVIEVTERCNFRCKYCFNSHNENVRHHSSKQMSLEIAKKSIDYYMHLYTDFYERLDDTHKQMLLKYYNPSIGFYGGEPTMNLDVVIKATKYLFSLKWEEFGIPRSRINVTINTNLSHIDSQFLSFIIENNIMLFASLDGPQPYNDSNRIDVQGNGTFDLAYSNLMKIKETNEEYFKNKVSILAVQTDDCNRDENKNFLESLGCNILYLEQSPYDCFISNPSTKTLNLDMQMKEIIETTLNSIERYKDDDINKCLSQLDLLYFLDEISTEMPTKGHIPKTFLSCPMGIDNIMISVNGDMHICHKTDGSMPFGNVFTGINENKIVKLYKDYIEATNNKECRSCWAFHFCPFCGATRMKNGKFCNPQQEECDYIRKGIELKFVLFIEIYKHYPELISKLLEYKRNPEHYKSIVDFNIFTKMSS